MHFCRFFLQSVSFIILFTSYFTSGYSQILNVEKSRIDKDSSNYFLGNISFSLTSNNRSAAADDPIEFFSMNGKGELAYFSRQHAYMLLTNLEYLAINKDPFISTGYVHGRTNFYRNKKLSYEIFSQAQYDLLRGLDIRLLAGASLRLILFKNDKYRFTVSTGLMEEFEKWQHPDKVSESVSIRMLKSSNYFSFRGKINQYIDINSITYYQVGYDNRIGDFRPRVNGEMNLLFKINKRFSLKTSFAGSYETRPIVPITKYIYSFTNGIQVNL